VKRDVSIRNDLDVCDTERGKRFTHPLAKFFSARTSEAYLCCQ
jgi:hypothetical protein